MKRALSLLLALVLCAGLLSALGSASAASLEERQKIVVATALAYYEKGQSLQYDGNTICNDIARKYGGKTRSTNQEAPEYATPNETLYSVCSDFAHQVYYEAFRYSVGVVGTVFGDVFHRFLDAVHHPDRQDAVEIFGVPVGFRRGGAAGRRHHCDLQTRRRSHDDLRR